IRMCPDLDPHLKTALGQMHADARRTATWRPHACTAQGDGWGASFQISTTHFQVPLSIRQIVMALPRDVTRLPLPPSNETSFVPIPSATSQAAAIATRFVFQCLRK